VKIHEKYISRCIQLGKNGAASSYPNPSVGSVIVYQEKIIGEGYTGPYGGPHAEVNAINSVEDISLLSKATLYVTLEPCSHFGKTPPCADLIIKHKIPRVVIGLKDPHKKVAGQGIARLKKAGVTVVFNVLVQECREHHKRFLKFHEHKRPYFILKWAESFDGFLAPSENKRAKHPEPYWITTSASKQLVHQWRSEEQGILVGTTTVLADNPKLSVRDWSGRSPIRLVLDRSLKISTTYAILDGSVKTIVFTAMETPAIHHENIYYETIDFAQSIPQQIAKIAYRHHILSVIVEGGAQTLSSFIETNLWDEARVFMGNSIFEKGLKAPRILQTPKEVKKIGTVDILKTYYND